MKKNIAFLLLVSLTHLLVLLTFLTGCVEEERLEGTGIVPEGDGIATVDVKLDAASMLGTDDLESKIHNVRILAFRTMDGSLKLNKYINYSSGYDAEKDVIEGVIKTGLTDVIVLANETADMKAAFEQPSENITKESVRAQIFSLSEAAALIKEDSLAANGIPMYQESDNLEIKIDNTKNNPYLLEVMLERILAKVTLTIQNQTHQEISLTSVTAKGLPQNSWLSPTNYTGETHDLGSIQLQFNEATKGYQPVSFYLPEYLLTDISKRSYLEIEGTATRNGAEIPCLYKISLGNGVNKYGKETDIESAIFEKALEETDLHIIRNTHYEIHVSDIKGYENDKITFLVGVTPWFNVSEGYFEGGTWVHQPVSQRIAISESTKFTAKFTHSEAPFIMYEWHRRRYLQTEADKEPVAPVDEIVFRETLTNGEISSYNVLPGVDPTASGEIYCKAAPIGGKHYRESTRTTLMVIGDWEGGGDAFPYMQNWIPKKDMPLGASYLLRDMRDNKVYRTKLMADGNWWMIQDLAYKDPSKELTPIGDFYDVALTSAGRPGRGALDDNLYGTCCSSNEITGGYLYTRAGAIGLKQGFSSSNSKLQEDIVGVCPEGWHLPGNKDAKWNQEWILLMDSIAPVTVKEIQKFGYFNDNHFNAYTSTYTEFNETLDELEYRKEGAFRFHGGYFTISSYLLSLGVKIGIDSVKIPQQKDDLYIFTNPVEENGVVGSYDDFVLAEEHNAAPIRCIRDYKYN